MVGRGPDGAFHVKVSHLSGLAIIEARLQFFDELLTSAFESQSDTSGQISQLRTDAAGLPATTSAVVADVTALYTGRLQPALAHAGDDIGQLRLVAMLLAEFGGLYDLLQIGELQISLSI